MNEYLKNCSRCNSAVSPQHETDRAQKPGGRCRKPDCEFHGDQLKQAWQLLEGEPLSRRDDVQIYDASRQAPKHRKLALEDPEHCAWHLRQSARARLYGEFTDLRGDINRETDHREAAT